MNTDIRLSVFFFQHRKTKKLKRKLGADGVLALISLWTYAAVNHPEGILPLDEEDIAIAADWDGDPQEFVNTLIEIGFLEKLEDGTYKIHDWEEHQPWAVGARERKEKARKAAKAKWEKMSEEEKEEHARKMAEARWGNKESITEEKENIYAKCLQDACNPQAECLQDACSMLADACVNACPSPFLSSPYLSSPILTSPNQKKEKEEENKKYSCSVSSANADETRTTTSNNPPLLKEKSPTLEKQEDTKKQKLPKGLILSSLRETPKEKRYNEDDIVIKLPIKGDKSYKEVLLTHDFVNELKELFPAVDVENCLKKMYAWLCANEKRQKTKQGIKKFITTWLSKEQDSATRRRTLLPSRGKPDIPVNSSQREDPLYEWKKRLGVPTHLDLTESQLKTLEKLSPAGRKTLIASWMNWQEEQKGGEQNVELH